MSYQYGDVDHGVYNECLRGGRRGYGGGTPRPAGCSSWATATSFFSPLLHTDHWGDLVTLWAGGWTAGRAAALGIRGPRGATPEMGTKCAVEHFLKAYNWDAQLKEGVPDPMGDAIKACAGSLIRVKYLRERFDDAYQR